MAAFSVFCDTVFAPSGTWSDWSPGISVKARIWKKLRGPLIRALGMRVSFPIGWSDFKGGSFAAQHPVLLVSDLMFKGMRGFGWPASLVTKLMVNGGARLGVLCSVLAEPCRAKKPELAVLRRRCKRHQQGWRCRSRGVAESSCLSG